MSLSKSVRAGSVRLVVSMSFVCGLAATGVLAAGCPGGPNLVHDECLRVIELDDGIYRIEENDEHVGQVTQPLSVKSSAIWDTARIPVCWETWGEDRESRIMRDDVRTAIRETWETALSDDRIPEEDRVRFVGWGRCNGENDGIRIAVDDNAEENPHVEALGNELKNVPRGMVLNFAFNEWESEDCGGSFADRRWCNKVIAIHEFGHALGLPHEQNRIDTPREECEDAPQGDDGDVYYGAWDLDSIMNYCNPKWNNYGTLSAGDSMWIKAIYYPEVIQANWCALVADRLETDPDFDALGDEERASRIRELLVEEERAEALEPGIPGAGN